MFQKSNYRTGEVIMTNQEKELLNEPPWEHMSPAEYEERLYNSGHKSLARALEKHRKARDEKEIKNDD